ncbi:MAG: hypothetical protein J0L92_08785 [Deltaproteobacteria bacterium]|nr:hypothetical protein [Deltaproteobacteria bacterium]
MRERVLVDHLVETARAMRADRATLATWAALAGLPEGEVVASPFGARMIALGLEAGARTVHHELRPLLTWHRSVRPRGATRDPLHGQWHRGALRTGKYEEFCQEDPFCTYHPEHSAKWAPHEMLHRAVGFHAPAEVNGFTRYVAARLNELLPVATWYGLEHALRLDRNGPFDRALEGRELDAPIERARWLHEDERSLARRARKAAPLLRWTLERTSAELAAIDEELASGTLIPSRDAGAESFPDVRLDASADALAYVHAHERRLSSPAVARVTSALARQHHSTLGALRTRVDDVLDRLLFARLASRPSEVRRAIAANVVHDLLSRAALVRPVDDALHRGLVDGAHRLIRAKRVDSITLASLGAELVRSLTPSIGRARAESIATLGLTSPIVSIDVAATRRGVSIVAPHTAAWLGRAGTRVVVDQLVAEGPARGHLATRIARIVAPDDLPLSELARLEGVLDRPPAHDPRVAWSIEVADAEDDARVSLRGGARIERFTADVLQLHRGEPADDEPRWVATAHVDAQPVLCELPDRVATTLTSSPSHRLGALRRAIGAQAVETLVEVGLLVVLPA